MRKIICKRLRQLRKKHGYSQAEVAEAIYRSQNTYSLIETGKTKLDIEMLLEIAEFYKVSIDELIDTSLLNYTNK